MSLQGYQNALARLIASPERCLAARADPAATLAGFDLDERERRRLAAVVWQPGMSVSCTLYRVNRITPIYSLLPLTCKALGDRLLPVAERYWTRDRRTDLQFGHEIERFAAFLRDEIATGTLAAEEWLPDVLAFEIAVNRLRYLPRQRLLEEAAAAVDRRHPPRLHPLVAVVAFSREPSALLEALAGDGSVGPAQGGEHYLCLDGRGPEVELSPLPPEVGRAARSLGSEAGPGAGPGPHLLEILLDDGLAVRAPRPLAAEA